jgi:hypothetical protein
MGLGRSLALPPSAIAWESVVERAVNHRVAFFLHRHLDTLFPADSIPESVRQSLNDHLRRQTIRALLLLGHQRQLATELDRAGIPAVWLKGLALSEQLYGRFESRDCEDLDLLLERQHLAAAEDVLRDLGYQSAPGLQSHPVSEHHRAWCRGDMPHGGVMVELHHRLAGPAACQPPAGEIIRRFRTVAIQGNHFRVPAVEDEMLILALHGHQHHFRVVRCVMDVAEYEKRYGSEIDWPRVWEDAARYRCRGRLAASLWVADRLLGLGSPERAPTAWSALGPIQRWAVRAAGVPKALTEPADDHFRRIRLGLLMDRTTDTLRLLGPRVLPPGDYVRERSPGAWRRWPGGAHLWYLGHSAGRLFRARSQT